MRGVSSELKVQTSVLYDMVLERESTQPFLTRDEIDTIIGNICSSPNWAIPCQNADEPFSNLVILNIFYMCLICVLYVRLNMVIIYLVILLTSVSLCSIVLCMIWYLDKKVNF